MFSGERGTKGADIYAGEPHDPLRTPSRGSLGHRTPDPGAERVTREGTAVEREEDRYTPGFGKEREEGRRRRRRWRSAGEARSETYMQKRGPQRRL